MLVDAVSVRESSTSSRRTRVVRFCPRRVRRKCVSIFGGELSELLCCSLLSYAQDGGPPENRDIVVYPRGEDLYRAVFPS